MKYHVRRTLANGYLYCYCFLLLCLSIYLGGYADVKLGLITFFSGLLLLVIASLLYMYASTIVLTMISMISAGIGFWWFDTMFIGLERWASVFYIMVVILIAGIISYFFSCDQEAKFKYDEI